MVFVNTVGGFPQSAARGFESCGCDGGRIDFEIERKAIGKLFHELVGFGEQVTCVEHDDRDVRLNAADEVKHDRGLDAEAGGKDEAVAECIDRPSDCGGSILSGELFVDRVEIKVELWAIF